MVTESKRVNWTPSSPIPLIFSAKFGCRATVCNLLWVHGHFMNIQLSAREFVTHEQELQELLPQISIIYPFGSIL